MSTRIDLRIGEHRHIIIVDATDEVLITRTLAAACAAGSRVFEIKNPKVMLCMCDEYVRMMKEQLLDIADCENLVELVRKIKHLNEE